MPPSGLRKTVPVCERLLVATCSGVPSATISPPPAAAFRIAEVNDPVCFGDQIQVVLDDDDRMSGVYQSPKTPTSRRTSAIHASRWVLRDE